MFPIPLSALFGATIAVLFAVLVLDWRRTAVERQLAGIDADGGVASGRAPRVRRNTPTTVLMGAIGASLVLSQVQVLDTKSTMTSELERTEQQLRHLLISQTLSHKREAVSALLLGPDPRVSNDGVSISSFKESARFDHGSATVSYSVQGTLRTDRTTISIPLLLPRDAQVSTERVDAGDGRNTVAEYTLGNDISLSEAASLRLLHVEFSTASDFGLRVDLRISNLSTGDWDRPSILAFDPGWFPDGVAEYIAHVVPANSVLAVASPLLRLHEDRIEVVGDRLDSPSTDVHKPQEPHEFEVSYKSPEGLVVLMFADYPQSRFVEPTPE